MIVTYLTCLLWLVLWFAFTWALCGLAKVWLPKRQLPRKTDSELRAAYRDLDTEYEALREQMRSVEARKAEIGKQVAFGAQPICAPPRMASLTAWIAAFRPLQRANGFGNRTLKRAKARAPFHSSVG